MQSLIHLIMHEARPASRRVSTARLRRVLGQQLLKVRRAVAARVEPRKELDVCLQGELVVGSRVFGEARHHRVQEFPRGAA